MWVCAHYSAGGGHDRHSDPLESLWVTCWGTKLGSSTREASAHNSPSGAALQKPCAWPPSLHHLHKQILIEPRVIRIGSFGQACVINSGDQLGSDRGLESFCIEGSECLDWYRSFLGIGLIKHFCKQISRSLMWPQSTMFSALALQADVCLGHEAEHFPLIPVEGSTLEHRAPVRGHHIFASATVSRFVPTAQLLREESPREYFILHVVLEEQALQSSGKNMLCVSKKKNLDARTAIIKITQCFPCLLFFRAVWTTAWPGLLRAVLLDFSFYLWVQRSPGRHSHELGNVTFCSPCYLVGIE